VSVHLFRRRDNLGSLSPFAQAGQATACGPCLRLEYLCIAIVPAGRTLGLIGYCHPVFAYLFLETNWGTTSVVALALSALSKFFAVVLLPVFLRKTGLRKLQTFLAVMILFYLPYASIGLHIFGGLSNFSRDWENNDSVSSHPMDNSVKTEC
jgi:hypothetical protein